MEISFFSAANGKTVFKPVYSPLDDTDQIKIEYCFSSASLYSFLKIHCNENTSLSLDSIISQLPADTYNEDEFHKQVDKDLHFTPFGEKVHEYTLDNDTFEYYSCNFETRNFTKYLNRLQHLLVFFIDGVQCIEYDLRWSLVTVYKANEFVGFCSYYNFYHYPESTRVRISQFFILPPFQKKGHGSRLYEFLFSTFRLNDDVYDVTVEDPNDYFQDLRDKCDARMLWRENALMNRTCTSLTRSDLDYIHSKFKLSEVFVCIDW
jgi:histone acetyltransferase 1